MTCSVRPLRGWDVPQVVAIAMEAFQDDGWTAATGRGWLARATRGGRARHATELARFITLMRLHQVADLFKLIRLLVLGQPPGLSYLVAEAEDGEIAGFACLSVVAGGEAFIPKIAVRPGRRGQKIGTHLLAELITMARAGGCRGISLYVRAGNAGARRLYRRTGFTEVGVRPRFYQPSGADAVVMRLPASGPEGNRVRGDALVPRAGGRQRLTA